MNELVDQIALRLRHNAAMNTIETAADADARAELLYQVLAPSPRLLEASRAAAVASLQHQHRRETIAA